MGTVNQLLELAREQLGTTSGEKYWRKYRGDTYVNGDVTAYCAYWCSWLLDETNTECPWFPNAYAFDPIDVAGERYIEKHCLKPGDIITFDWDNDYRGDHVGVVETVHDWGCGTMEGNTSGGIVARKQRLWSQILCGVRPYYDIDTDEGTWKSKNGGWWYEFSDGSYVKNDWKKIDGKWYHFNENGWLQGGWLLDKGKWYWLHDKHDGRFGEMESSKVLEYKNKYYILGSDGALITEPKIELTDPGTYGSIIF